MIPSDNILHILQSFAISCAVDFPSLTMPHFSLAMLYQVVPYRPCSCTVQNMSEQIKLSIVWYAMICQRLDGNRWNNIIFHPPVNLTIAISNIDLTLSVGHPQNHSDIMEWPSRVLILGWAKHPEHPWPGCYKFQSADGRVIVIQAPEQVTDILPSATTVISHDLCRLLPC